MPALPQSRRRARRLPAEREAEVARLLTQCVSHTQICAYLSQKWECTVDTVQRAINEVYSRWAELPSLDRASRREQMRQALFDLYNTAKKNGAYSPAVTALDRLCRLDGLYEAEKVEISDKSGVGVAETDPDAVRQRIRDLYAKYLGGEVDAVGVPTSRAVEEPVGAGGEGPPESDLH